MKYLVLVIFAVLAFAAADEEWKPPSETAAQIDEMCVEESGITPELRKRISKSYHADEKEVHDYVLCSVKKFGVFTDESGYDVTKLMGLLGTFKLDQEKVREILNKCIDSNEQKSVPRVWAYRGFECMMNSKMDELFKEAQDRMKNANKL